MDELSALPILLRDDTARLLERFYAADLNSVAHDAALTAQLAAAFAKSNFIAQYAIRWPGAFLDLIAAPTLSQVRTPAVYDEQLTAALANCDEFGAAQGALRRLRRAEMVRIAWRDLQLGTSVEIIMTELSALADAVLSHSLAWLQRALEPRYGRAYDEDGVAMNLLVLAMGKLGGSELNFSSDIDLLFIYAGDGVTRGGRKDREHQDYFDRLGRDLIALLNEKTADGLVFRVDMRLRPFGDSGPLTSSLAALEHYYAVHGRDWERYALIKARVVCGDASCRTALAALVRPFVFRRYLDYGALDALREMKALIEREARSETGRDDVKRGHGGIREIEFTAQLVQLTRGGREPRLRNTSLLPTLAVCAELGLLDAADVARLSASYCFLRMVEHRLQEMRDEQTHRLPHDEGERARLAYAAGFDDWSSFAAALAGHRQTTRGFFEALLSMSGAHDEDTPAARTVWHDLWQHALDDDLPARLVCAGRPQPALLVEVVRALNAERLRARLSEHSRLRLDRIMPVLLAMICTRGIADDTVQRVAALLHAIAGRSVYLAFLADHPDALTRLLDLFAASAWIAQQITRYPRLLDELLDPRVLYAPPDQTHLRALLAAQLGDADGLEVAMETLRSFKNSQVLRVAASDITAQFPIAEVSNQLSYIAQACVDNALQLAWRDLVARYGEPTCTDHGQRRSARLCVIAYGKLGGWELGYGSDLDLVFLHDSSGEAQHTDGARVVENHVFFARLVQRLIHIISTVTPSGATYAIDTRLRPSGAAGQLVVNCEAFADYQRAAAWVWEHQALVRARAIAGDSALAQRFNTIRAQVLAQPREALALKREVLAMRTRMAAELDRSDAHRCDLKHGLGGITDIEFMVQYAVLRWAGAYPSLLIWTDNLRLLETIADLGLLPAALCRGLHDAYFAYRAALHRCALQQQDGLVDARQFETERQEVRQIWTTVLA